jgi:hypothetical protein
MTCARCGERAVVVAMRTHGIKIIGNPWYVCAAHAPKASTTVDVIELGVPDGSA